MNIMCTNNNCFCQYLIRPTQYDSLSVSLPYIQVSFEIFYSSNMFISILISLAHRNALLIIRPLTSAISSDRLIPAWQSHKIGNT